ncbi:MAG: PEP-CTERM sorting domain-containing protein [Terracidiphilus sp.]|jgi:hypothetical protein
MIPIKLKLLTFALASASLCAAANASTVFNFDSDNVGTSTTFTDTVDGLSATFSSDADPGGFVIYPSIFDTLTGNVLGDPGPAGQQDNLFLDVNFSQTLNAVDLDFATADFGTPSIFGLIAFDNGFPVAEVFSTGTFLPGFTFPEGEISLSGVDFNSIELESDAPDFAVDNIAVDVATTPEPSSWLLLGTAMFLMALFARRAYTLRPLLGAGVVAFVGMVSGATPASAQVTQSIFPLLPPSVSTIPSNGDVNPYGVVFAPSNTPKTGILQPGNILVSNFNNSQNLQGLGTTIICVDKFGNTSTFFTAPANQSGLTAALGVLSDGIVLVGNLPTADGTPATVQAGRLSVLSSSGQFLGTIGNVPANIDGPWGMAIHDTGNGVTGTAQVFVSNVLSGVISRFTINYTASSLSATVMVLADGFNHRLDSAALVLGPSGMAYSASNDTLYIASSTDNAIYEITGATQATSTVTPTLLVQDSTRLHGPLDITILPDGNLVVANSDGSNADPNQPSELVEYTPEGTFLAEQSVDPNNGGAFGVASYNIGWGTFRLAAVDDNTNILNIWTAVAP